MHKSLIAISTILFVLGLVFPVGAKLINPFLAYGIMVISWPAWGIGAICGGFVGFRSKKKIPSNTTFFLDRVGFVYGKYNSGDYYNLDTFLCKLN